MNDLDIQIGDYNIVGKGFIRPEDGVPHGVDDKGPVELATVVMVELHEGKKILLISVGDALVFDAIPIQPGMYRFDARGPKRVGDLPNVTA